MAESPLDDLDGLGQEIDRLWAKVASSSTQEIVAAPSALPDVSPSQRLAWETVAILKRQHRDETQTWEEALSSKEEALRALQQRVARLEAEKAGLTKSLRATERTLVEQALEVKGQLEEGSGAFEVERAQREGEARALRAMLEQVRQRLAEDEARWQAERRQWEEKERQFVIDLREREAVAARHQEESARAIAEARRLSDGFNQVKSALEKTLAELLCERHDRETSDQERQRAFQKLAETEQHLQELSKLWDEERAQWGQLWERERAGRKTAPSEPPSAPPPVPVPAEPRRAAPSPRLWAALAAATALLAAGVLTARHLSSHRFQPLSTQTVAIASPTALAFDGTLLWLSSWDGRLLAYDPGNLEASVRSASPAELSPYHPSALVFGKESLWTMDATQSRLIRHKAADPSKIIASRPSPGPAPTALAFDGQALWSYDAARRALYRHGEDGALQPFALNAEPAVTAMAWAGDHLWVFDAKTQRLVDYQFKDGAFRPISRTPLNQPILSFAFASGSVDGRPPRPQFWALVGPDASHQASRVVKYAY